MPLPDRWLKALTLLIVAGACLGPNAGPARADEQVRFDSAAARPSPFRERLAKQRGEVIPPAQGVPLIGYLSRPQGDGPFPAVVVMHGCGGLSSRVRNAVPRQLVSWGYAVLVVDSFATREVKSTCANLPSDSHYSLSDRVFDAYGALDFLSGQGFVDPKRIALMGFSAGAVSTLEATKTDGDEQLMDRKFKAAVAYYPTCRASEGDATVPTLIMVGELDDWGPPERCRQRVSHLSGKGPPFQLVIYPGAYHDFDAPGEKGRTYFGHRLQYDASAAEKSVGELQAFLRKFLAD